jgi:uncharacterized membrane protein
MTEVVSMINTLGDGAKIAANVGCIVLLLVATCHLYASRKYMQADVAIYEVLYAIATIALAMALRWV